MTIKPKKTLSNGSPIPSDGSYAELDPITGMQKNYVVLSEEERAKGFVRPVLDTYTHVGKAPPRFPLRDLTPEEHAQYDKYGYVKYEEYVGAQSSVTGRFWTQDDLNRIDAGCGAHTTMSRSIAETYARDPEFYGSTFCIGCRKHLPVDEFVWVYTNRRLGS